MKTSILSENLSSWFWRQVATKFCLSLQQLFSPTKIKISTWHFEIYNLHSWLKYSRKGDWLCLFLHANIDTICRAPHICCPLVSHQGWSAGKFYQCLLAYETMIPSQAKGKWWYMLEKNMCPHYIQLYSSAFLEYSETEAMKHLALHANTVSPVFTLSILGL